MKKRLIEQYEFIFIIMIFLLSIVNAQNFKYASYIFKFDDQFSGGSWLLLKDTSIYRNFIKIRENPGHLRGAIGGIIDSWGNYVPFNSGQVSSGQRFTYYVDNSSSVYYSCNDSVYANCTGYITIIISSEYVISETFIKISTYSFTIPDYYDGNWHSTTVSIKEDLNSIRGIEGGFKDTWGNFVPFNSGEVNPGDRITLYIDKGENNKIRVSNNKSSYTGKQAYIIVFSTANTNDDNLIKTTTFYITPTQTDGYWYQTISTSTIPTLNNIVALIGGIWDCYGNFIPMCSGEVGQSKRITIYADENGYYGDPALIKISNNKGSPNSYGYRTGVITSYRIQ